MPSGRPCSGQGGRAFPAGLPTGPAPPVSAQTRLPCSLHCHVHAHRASPGAGILSCPLDAQSPSAFTLRSLGLAPMAAAVTSLLYKVFVLPSCSHLVSEVLPGPCCHPIVFFPSAPCAITALFSLVPVVCPLSPVFCPLVYTHAWVSSSYKTPPSHHDPCKLMS